MSVVGKKKTLVGTVLTRKMDKTVVVSVERLTKHPLYGKYIKRSKKYMAHDEKNHCSINDRVVIAQTRPISKLKNWRVINIVEKVG
ncbi:MAG: 30S ribosomal protein S17 [Deltaproteobacteria bacterium]|nr:30S ribosomal protein S17 [Deltaproteobacteria bacterium]